MASWPSGKKIGGDNRIRLPSVQQKSKIPVRMTGLNSDSNKSSSKEDESEKRRHFPRESVDKLGNKRPSRIPIAAAEQKKNNAEKKKVCKNKKPVEEQKPLAKHSGINLHEEHRKQSAVKDGLSPPASAKRRHYGASKGSTKQVRPRTPRGLTPLENKMVSKNTEVPRDENSTSTSDTSSTGSTDDVTSDFECNVACEDGVLTPAETTVSGSDVDDEFQRQPTSSDERELLNAPPMLKEAVKEPDSDSETNVRHAAVVDSVTVNSNPAPKDICTDFVAAGEQSKILEQLSHMKDCATEEVHVDAMESLLLLDEEDRERKTTEHENHDIIKHDAILASSTNRTEEPNLERNFRDDFNTISDEELDFNSMSMDSEGEGKIAELDDKARMLKEKYAKENRLVMEKIENIKKELRESKEKEATFTQEFLEMKMRSDALEEDLGRLDEARRRQEGKETKWRKKMDKKRKKNSRRLEKAQAQRPLDLKEIQAENDLPEGQNDAVQEMGSATGNQNSEECNNDNGTESCLNFDVMVEDIQLNKGQLQTSLEKEVDEGNNALNEIVVFTNQENEKLKGQVIAMKKEKESLQTELETVKLELKRLKASEESRISEEGNKLNEMTGVKARITAGLQDQIEQLKNQNCRMSAKMSKASDNSTQLSECQDKKARIAAEVNCSQVVTELSKASDNRLKDLLEQVENLKKQNQYLQEEASEAKKQLANKMDYIPTEALEDNKYARRALKKKRREIKKLKKRVGRNEREIEVLEKFIRQGGPDNIATRGWLARQIKQREDMEKELENIKQRVHQKENELDQTRRALRILVETTQALRGRIDELENCVEFLCEDSHTLNSDIPSISDDSCPDIFHDEPEMIGAQRQNMNKEERIEAEEVSITEEDTGSKGLSTISEEETGAKESNMNKEEGSGAADVSIITGEDAEINEFPSVSEKEVGVNGRTMNSEKEHGAEEVFIKTEEDTGNKLFFSMTEEEAGAKGPKINKEEEDGGVDVSVVTEEDPGNRGLLTTTDEDVGPKGRTKNNEKEEDDAANELLSSTTQGESGTEGLSIIGYRDAVSKGLPVNSVGDNGPRELTSLNTDGNDRSKGMPMNTNKDDGSQELTVYSDENDKSKDMTAGVKESSIVMESKLEHLDQILKDSTEDIELLTATLRHKREFWTQKKRFGGREHVAWLSKQLGQRNHEIEKQKNVFKAKEQQLEAFAKESMEVVESLDATVKELQEELERTQSSLNLQTTLLANAEERYEGIIRQLQRDLETIQISLKEKTDTLEETEARLQLQTSRSANAETKHGDIVDELQEARLQQRTLLLDNVEERYEFIAKELQGDLETMKISLKAKTDALEETESKLQLQSSLHAYVEERYEGIVKELQGDLENMHISLKLKTDALEETETRLQQQTSLLADVEERYDFIVKELQGELDIVQIALRGKNDALEESESRLQLQSSLHANVEERYEAIVKELQGDLQSMLILLKEKEDTLEKTEARLQQKMSFLANVEERYEFIVKGLQGDLETMKISLKTKTDALEETETRLKLQRSLLASAETKHGDIVKRLEDDLKCAQISLKEKQTALEDAEAKLRLKTSVLSSFQDNDLEELQTENKDDILKAKTMINRLEEELETSKISLKEKAKALEQTQEGLELKTLRLSEIEGDLQRAENAVKEDVVALEKAEFDYQLKSSLVHSLQAKACLRENELEELKLTIKGRDLELERVDGSLNELKKLMEMLYTNNEPKGLQEMVFPVEPTQDEELVGDEKANLLREVLAANAGFKAEKIMADREKSFLREQINSALEELKEKSKQIWDLEMDLKETRMQVSRLESKKQEMEELQGGELLQSHAEFTKQENRVWRSESHRLENEFLLEGIDEMINCDGQNVSSRPLMWTAVDASKTKNALGSDVDTAVDASRHGDLHTSEGSGNKRIPGQQCEECLSLRELETINRPARDVTERDWTSHRALLETAV